MEPVLPGEPDKEVGLSGNGLEAGEVDMAKLLVERLCEEFVALGDGAPFKDMGGCQGKAFPLETQFLCPFAASGERLTAKGFQAFQFG